MWSVSLNNLFTRYDNNQRNKIAIIIQLNYKKFSLSIMEENKNRLSIKS